MAKEKKETIGASSTEGNDDKLTLNQFKKKYPEHADLLSGGVMYADDKGNTLKFESYFRSTTKSPTQIKVLITRIDGSTTKATLTQDQFLSFLNTYKKPDTASLIGPDSKAGESQADKLQEAGLILDVDEERDPARAGALHTLYKLNKSPDHDIADLVPESEIKNIERDSDGKLVRIDLHYDPDKNLPDEAVERTKAMNEKFNELSRKLCDSFVTHGYAKEQEDGTFKMVKEISDLDGESCLALYRLAGLDTSKVKYVPQGQGGDEEGFVVDTSENDGIVAQEGGKRVIKDHHGEESDRTTSATKHVYNFLIENGLLKKEDYLDKFVEFVTEEDNKAYFESDIRENFKNSWRTLRGLNYYIEPEEIIRLFKNGTDPDKPLGDDYLESYRYVDKANGDKTKAKSKSLKEIAEGRKRSIIQSEGVIKYLEKVGFVFDTGKDNFGRILVDPGVKEKGKRKKRVSLGHDAVRAAGYGGYLVWAPDENGFVLYTTKPLKSKLYPEKEIRFSQGFNVRGNMWMKVRDKETLQVTPEEIISKLSRKRTAIPEALRRGLEKEGLLNVPGRREGSKEQKFSPERMEVMGFAIGNFSKGGKEMKELIEGGTIIKLTGTDEEKKKNLRERIEKYLRDGLKKYSTDLYKLSDEEIEYVKEQCMESIFSK